MVLAPGKLACWQCLMQHQSPQPLCPNGWQCWVAHCSAPAGNALQRAQPCTLQFKQGSMSFTSPSLDIPGRSIGCLPMKLAITACRDSRSLTARRVKMNSKYLASSTLITKRYKILPHWCRQGYWRATLRVRITVLSNWQFITMTLNVLHLCLLPWLLAATVCPAHLRQQTRPRCWCQSSLAWS